MENLPKCIPRMHLAAKPIAEEQEESSEKSAAR